MSLNKMAKSPFYNRSLEFTVVWMLGLNDIFIINLLYNKFVIYKVDIYRIQNPKMQCSMFVT